MSDWRIQIEPTNFRRWLDLYIFTGEHDFVQYELPTVSPLEEFEYPRKPSIRMEFSDGQSLMDELYRIGFRPSEGLTKDITNRDQHLSDMKRLVEKAYKVKF